MAIGISFLRQHSWEFVLLACLSVAVYATVWNNVNIKTQYRSIGLHYINSIALFLTVLIAVGIVAHILGPEGQLTVITVSAIALWFLFSLLVALNGPSAFPVRVILLLILLAVPLVTVLYMSDNSDLASDVLAYDAQRGETEDVGRNSSASFTRLLTFFFLPSRDLECAEQESGCAAVKRRLGRRAIPIFLVRFIYWFSAIFCILRYYGHALRVREDIARTVDNKFYDLRGSVIAQSAVVLSFGIAFFLSLFLAGVDFANLGLFGGLIAAGLSVALKDTLGNFAAGMVLLWDGTVRKGDVVTIDRPENPETGGTYGIVEDVRLRYTLVKDRDTVHRLIPNSVLISSVVENWTHDADRKVRIRIPVPIPYSCNLKQVRSVLEASCYEVPRVLRNPAPKALVTEFGSSAIEVSLRFWIEDPEQGIRAVISDVYGFVWERLSELGIEVPFSQVDLHVKDILGGKSLSDLVKPFDAREGMSRVQVIEMLKD